MELRTSHYTLLQGHALDVLRTLPDNSVHCVNTSSPYYGLRSYGTEPVVWAAPDGAPLCEHGRHEWVEHVQKAKGGFALESNPPLTSNDRQTMRDPTNPRFGVKSKFCTRCGAWRGELGQEPTPQLFIAHLVNVFREVRRVLRPDGVCFANIADSWAGSGKGYWEKNGEIFAEGKQATNRGSVGVKPRDESGIPSKSAMLIPERFVIALQDDGWIVRMPIVWAKGISFIPNYAGSVMPESVTDRPTKSYEMIYMLAKSARYYWDKWAVAEQGKDWGTRDRTNGKYHNEGSGLQPHGGLESSGTSRNLRSVWAINPEPSSLRHYAMQPSKIAETVIRAGTSERGVCPTCGAPWVRVTKRMPGTPDSWNGSRFDDGKNFDVHPNVGRREDQELLQEQAREAGTTAEELLRLRQMFKRANAGIRDDTGRTKHTADQRMGKTPPPEKGWESVTDTIGWRPSCACPETEPIPATVLDPFSGAGTTGVIAKRLGRDYIGIELKNEYIAIAREHIDSEPDPLFVAESHVQPASDESLEQLAWTLDT